MTAAQLVQLDVASLTRPPERCDTLTDAQIWTTPEVSIWQPARFVGKPWFYPVYRWQDLYSYTPLALLLYKKSLRVNRHAAWEFDHPEFLFHSGKDTIDRDIERVGGPLPFRRDTTDANQYASAVASSLRSDIAAVEAEHPDWTNIILCGGKDSLNLLLLGWKNPVIVASGQPNYPLVEEFVRRNHLEFPVVELNDGRNDALQEEILAASGMIRLDNVRWTAHLRELAMARGGRVIFWLGLAADAYLTPYWWDVRMIRRPADGLRRVVRECAARSRVAMARRFAAPSWWQQRRFVQATWDRIAMWQGMHLSVIRTVTGALALSAYHGPAMTRVFHSVNLAKSVPDDIRPRVGQELFGKEVWYPAENPHPAANRAAERLVKFEQLANRLQQLGVEIRG